MKMNLLDLQFAEKRKEIVGKDATVQEVAEIMAKADKQYEIAIEKCLSWEQLSSEGKVARIQHKIDTKQYITAWQWKEYKSIMVRDHNIVVCQSNLRGWN